MTCCCWQLSCGATRLAAAILSLAVIVVNHQFMSFWGLSMDIKIKIVLILGHLVKIYLSIKKFFLICFLTMMDLIHLPDS